MTAPAPLSAVEVESLRMMRTRLNKPAVSDAAAATLGRAFLTIAGRCGFGPSADPMGLQVIQAALGRDLAGFEATVKDAPLKTLGLLAAALAERGERPAEWRRMTAAGLPQALIARRLQLAGREGVEARL